MQQTKRRRGSNGACMYWTSVCSARTVKKSLFLMRGRALLLTSHASGLFYFILLNYRRSSCICSPCNPQRAVSMKFSQIRGRLVGPCVTPDKLDLLLIAGKDFSAPSNSSLLTARCCLWLSHMGHMKVRACRAADHQQCIAHLHAGLHIIVRASEKERWVIKTIN